MAVDLAGDLSGDGADGRRRGAAARIAAALLVAIAPAAIAPATAAAAPAPGARAPAKAAAALAEASADLDGDGAADALRLEVDVGLMVRLAGGRTLMKVFAAAGTLESGAITVGAGERYGAGSVVVATGRFAGGGAETMVLRWEKGELREVWRGPVGKVGRDGEYSVHVEITPYGLLRFQRRPDVYRCDGAPVYLAPERLDFASGGFKPVLKALAVAEGAPVLTATRTPPGEAPGRGAVFHAEATSTASGMSDASDLVPPRALDDGDPATAWREDTNGFGRGDFFTFATAYHGASVQAVRIVPGDASTPAAWRGSNRLRRAALVTPGEAFWIEIPTDPARSGAVGDAWWVTLPRPVPASCVSLVIAEVWPGDRGADTAIAEIAVLTDLDLARGGAEAALVARIAAGGAEAEPAARLLARRGAAATRAVLAALGGEGNLDLDAAATLRLRRALAATGDASGAGQLAEGLAVPGIGEADRALFAGALERLGAGAVAPLAALLGDGEAAENARQAAADALGGIGDRAAGAALRAAAGSGSRTLRRTVGRALGGREPGELAAVLAAAREAAASGASGDGAAVAGGGREADLWRAAGMLALRTAPEARAEAVAAMAARLGEIRDYELRYRLLAALAPLPEEAAVAAVRGALEGLDGGAEAHALREVAIGGLARNPAPAAAPIVVGLLDARSPGVRRHAADALADRGDDGDAAALAALAVRLSDDRWPDVRRTAATALGQRCKREAAARPLFGAVDRDADVEIRRSALDALVTCRARGIEEKLFALARDGGAPLPLRERAVADLGLLADPALAPRMIELFASLRSAAWGSEEALRLAALAAVALGKVPSKAVDAPLLDAAREGSFPELQSAAASALGERCPREAAPLLAQLSRVEDRTVSLAASRARAACRRRAAPR